MSSQKRQKSVDLVEARQLSIIKRNLKQKTIHYSMTCDILWSEIRSPFMRVLVLLANCILC